ncbi:MAG: RNA polymerase sigma factor [Actinomycetota bacterium]
MADIERFEETLTGARCGDAPSFDVLWRWLQPPLARYMTVAASDSWEDLASETWLQVARDIHRFRGDADAFRRWFFTIARRRVLDHARRQRRTGTVAAGAGHVPDLAEPSDPVGDRMSTRAALELIRTLPPAQAEAVALRVLADLSVKDVARILGKRPGAVRVLTSRGLNTLAEKLSMGGAEAIAAAETEKFWGPR